MQSGNAIIIIGVIAYRMARDLCSAHRPSVALLRESTVSRHHCPQMGGLSVVASKCARCFRDVWLASSRAFELGLALLSRIHPCHVLGGSADRADRRNVR